MKRALLYDGAPPRGLSPSPPPKKKCRRGENRDHYRKHACLFASSLSLIGPRNWQNWQRKGCQPLSHIFTLTFGGGGGVVRLCLLVLLSLPGCLFISTLITTTIIITLSLSSAWSVSFLVRLLSSLVDCLAPSLLLSKLTLGKANNKSSAKLSRHAHHHHHRHHQHRRLRHQAAAKLRLLLLPPTLPLRPQRLI